MRSEILFFFAILVLILSGCLQEKKELVIGEIWDIKSLDPIGAGTLVREKALIVENLVGMNPDLTLKPELAVKWERIDDLTWRFYLRKGVLFHDGLEMKAEHVKWSLERALKNPSIKKLTLIESISILDDYTIEIKTSKPFAVFPAALAYSNIAIISPNSKFEGDTIIAPIGTGPFRFVKFDQAQKALFVEKFEKYWGEKAKIDSWIIRAIPDPSARSLAVESGEVDLTYEIPYGDVERLSKKKELKVDIYQTNRVYQMNFGNLNDSIWQDVRVRKALSLAIDRKAIAEKILHGVAIEATGIVPPNLWWSAGNCDYYRYDPKKAKELLKEAGWADEDGDGVLEKDGKKFEITIYTYPQRPGLKPMAEAIQQYLKEIGIKAEIRVMDYEAIDKMMTKNDIRIAAFHQTMVPDPDYYLRRTYMTNGDFNTWGYSNPEVDRLLEEGIKKFEEAERKEIYKKVQEIVCSDLPIIHLAFYKVPVVYNEKVTNVKFKPAAHDLWLTQTIEKR
ncbi:MAG: ABC transporter substrate-binding protein [Archaeoglobaceae archaeon]